MNARLWLTSVLMVSMLAALPAAAQPGTGWGGGPVGERGHGMMGGMRGGMMGHSIASDVPDKLPAPKNAEWRQRLQEALDLERLSYAQYTSDAEKFNARMPYMMVTQQEVDHIQAIERLFKAYHLQPESKQLQLVETKTISDAFEVCIKMERDLISRYEWLVKNAEDEKSASIINEILIQTRQHLTMFERALNMGGGMGGMGGGMGPGMMR